MQAIFIMFQRQAVTKCQDFWDVYNVVSWRA